MVNFDAVAIAHCTLQLRVKRKISCKQHKPLYWVWYQ